MNKFGFLFTLFTSTATMALPGYFDVNEPRQMHAKLALDEHPELHPFRDGLIDFMSEESIQDPNRLDWYILRAFHPDTPKAVRKQLHEDLTTTGFLQNVRHYDEEMHTFKYDPSIVLDALLRDGPVDIIHLGGTPEEEEESSSSTGSSEDAVLPENFSWVNYMKSYPDLIKAWGTLRPTEQKMKCEAHYLKHGRKEGRTPIGTDFIPHVYILLHEDLRRQVSERADQIDFDLEAFALQHYRRIGRTRGWQYLPEGGNSEHYFPHESYLETYEDLPALFEEYKGTEKSRRIEEHFLLHGLKEGHRVVGLPAPKGRAITISEHARHCPDILANPNDLRLFATLEKRQAGEGASISHRLQKIAIHRQSAETPSLLHNDNLMEWISRVLVTDRTTLGSLELHGMGEFDEEKQKCLLPHRFQRLSYNAESGVLALLKLPEPRIRTMPKDYSAQKHAAATPGVGTPFKASLKKSHPTAMGSPRKQDQLRAALETATAFEEWGKERFAESGGKDPFLEGIQRGFRSEDYLYMNRDIMLGVLTKIGPCPLFSQVADFSEWEAAVGHWEVDINRSAQEIFLHSFDPESPHHHYFGRPCMLAAPKDLHWLDCLKQNPSFLMDIVHTERKRGIAGHVITFKTGVPDPKTHEEALHLLEGLDETIEPENQMRLALAVNRWIIESIFHFGEEAGPVRFRPWRATPPGFDLGAMQRILPELGEQFMAENHLTREQLEEPIVRMSFLTWCQDIIEKGYTYSGLGYPHLPYMPRGVYTSNLEQRLNPAFTEAMQPLIDEEALRQGNDLPPGFQFPVLSDFPELKEFLGAGERTIWRHKPTLKTDGLIDLGSGLGKAVTPDVANNRRLFNIWAQLFILDDLLKGRNDTWWHPSDKEVNDLTVQRGWKSMLEKHPELKAEFEAAPRGPGEYPRERYGSGGIHEAEESTAGAASGEATQIDALTKTGELAHWIQETWWNDFSGGKRGLSCHPELPEGFDILSFVELHHGKDDFPAGIYKLTQRLIAGELADQAQVDAINQITHASETYWLTQKAAGVELPWITLVLPRSVVFTDWLVAGERRVPMVLAPLPEGVDLAVLRTSLANLVPDRNLLDPRSFNIRVQEFFAGHYSEGYNFVTGMEAAPRWKAPEGESSLITTYPTILAQHVFDATGGRSINYGTWVQREYLRAGATHEERSQALSEREAQAREEHQRTVEAEKRRREATAAYSERKSEEEATAPTERRREEEAAAHTERKPEEEATAPTERRREEEAAAHTERKPEEEATAPTERRREEEAAAHTERKPEEEATAPTERRRKEGTAHPSHQKRLQIQHETSSTDGEREPLIRKDPTTSGGRADIRSSRKEKQKDGGCCTCSLQ